MAGPIHPIRDTDPHFTIDPISRAVKNEISKKISLVIGDKNSEVFTFELPRTIEGHDMAKCNKVEVHYVNTHHTTKEKSAEPYKVTDYGVDPNDPDKMVFSWTISDKATKYPGSLAFAVHFICCNELTDEEHYRWGTATNTTITVLDTTDLTQQTAEESTDLQEKTATPTKEVQVLRPDGDFRGLSKVVVEAIPEEFISPTGTLFVDANGDYTVREYDKIMVHVPDIPAKLQEKEITANGTHTPDTGFEGFSQVVVNVADIPAKLQEKTVYPRTSEQTVKADSDFDGLSKVTVGPMKLQRKTITQNGEAIPDDGYHGLAEVTVNVKPKLQSKLQAITKSGVTDIVPDSGYDGMERVTVSVEMETKLQEKIVFANGEVVPDEGFDGLSKVYVEVPETIPEGYIKPTGTKEITENGTHDVAAFASVTVAVPGEVVEEWDGSIEVV